MAGADAVDGILEQWRAERPDLDPSPMGVVGRISRLARQLERRLEPVFAAHGVEAGWFDVLAALRRSGPPFQLRPTELFNAVMLSSSGMTKRLDRMEREGLIRRRPDPGDRRGVLIELTESGRVIVDRAVEQHVANEADLLGGLTAREREQLAGLLRKLAGSLEVSEA